MKVFPQILQLSEAWAELRRGRPTASRFKDILTPKGKLSTSSVGYAFELIADCFATDVAPSFMGNAWMDRGIGWEGEARKAFAEHTGLDVVEVGFCTRDDEFVGCSPDGLIVSGMDYSAGVEIKCPGPKEHVRTVANGVLPEEHKAQVHGGLVVTGLPEWHFWSWCDGMNPFHCVVTPDEYTEQLAEAVDNFVISYAELRDRVVPLLRINPSNPEI